MNDDLEMVVADVVNDVVNDETASVRELSSPEDFDSALVNAVVTFLASLYDSDTLTEVQIQNIVDSHKQLLGGGFLQTLKNNVLDLLNKASNNQTVSQAEIDQVGRKFDSCQNMFSGFDTTYLRLKEFEDCGAYIKPESYVIGQATHERTAPGRTVVEPIALTGQYVPLRKVLKGFLELPGVFETVTSYQKRLEDQADNGTIENIVQGSLWREKIKPKFAGKLALPGITYFDEYEPNKELGHHTGTHKIAALYWKLACLPPEYQSSLDNIFLANLFHAGDKAFGNKQVYFATCLVIGDNLGANAILGLVESFVANFYCRLCREHKSIMRIQLESNSDALRNKQNYQVDVAAKNENETGIKEECCFNVLKSFHCAENFHCDTMHDLDEGAWNYDLCAIIAYFLRVKRFDLEKLNNLIQAFYYGPSEQRNKPPLITKEHIKNNKISFSASEMRCLMRYFGLIVGHLVKPVDTDVWNHYLLARNIMDIVTAPKIRRAQIPVLKGLIKKHQSSYLRVFGGHLLLKMHFMVHYPELISLIGPLEPLSCDRYEGKHKEGKQFAQVNHSRKDLPYSVAKRHQLKFCFRLLSRRGLSRRILSGPVQVLRVDRTEGFTQFADLFPMDRRRENWNVVKWISVNGQYYCVGMVLSLRLQNDLPLFGQIHTISIPKEGSVKFLTKRLVSRRFDEQCHAYEVEYQEWYYVGQEELLSELPSELRTGMDGLLYVALRHAQF